VHPCLCNLRSHSIVKHQQLGNIRVSRNSRKRPFGNGSTHVGDKYLVRPLIIFYGKQKTAGAFCATRMIQHNQLHIAWGNGNTIRQQTIRYYRFEGDITFPNFIPGSYRYSDVLLLIAEALNEQGKSSNALPYINQVRDRAFGAGASPVTASSQVLLRDIISKERSVELAFENHRWLDLVRTSKAIDVMTAYGAKVKANPLKYYYPAGNTPLAQSYNVTANRLLFPIPDRQVVLKPLLK
jgi:SusD family